MKGFLLAMVVLFAILAIVFYSNSIVSTDYGRSIANVQMTVFAAASAVLCGINLVGALLLTAIHSISITPASPNEKNRISEEETADPGYVEVESTTYT